VHGNTSENRQLARSRFVQPLLDHLRDTGIGHLPEVADGDPPHTPGGCPFQAWSLGELLRLLNVVLREPTATQDQFAVVAKPELISARP
jgi:glycogen debranching enzyme